MAWADWHTLRSILTLSSRAATRPDHPCADLRTRFLVMGRPAAWRHVQACIEGLDGRWQIEEETPASGTFHLIRRTPGRLFIDDVKVSLWVTESDPVRVGVDVISSSRVGKSDLGANARNIRDFYRHLEAYLQRIGPPHGREQAEPERSGPESPPPEQD